MFQEIYAFISERVWGTIATLGGMAFLLIVGGRIGEFFFRRKMIKLTKENNDLLRRIVEVEEKKNQP